MCCGHEGFRVSPGYGVKSKVVVVLLKEGDYQSESCRLRYEIMTTTSLSNFSSVSTLG